MNIIKLDYQGLPIHANREAWFNATEIRLPEKPDTSRRAGVLHSPVVRIEIREPDLFPLFGFISELRSEVL